MRPIILDFDQSVGILPDALSVDLGDQQEAVRFGCTLQTLQRLDVLLSSELPESHGPVFLGSGDFHHVSALLIRRASNRSRCRVVVFDNHPDNMRFPFGIHCGSWVSHVARLPNVSHVTVIGITSPDISAPRIWENRLWPLWSGRVSYWCLSMSVSWTKYLGLGSSYRVFHTAEEMINAFEMMTRRSPEPTYLSIDKDVLHPDVVRTNWDQGILSETHLTAAVRALGSSLIGVDVTGEVSAHAYSTAWKRWLSARDKQPTLSADEIAAWQRDHNRLNKNLLATLQTLNC